MGDLLYGLDELSIDNIYAKEHIEMQTWLNRQTQGQLSGTEVIQHDSLALASNK